MQQKRIVIDMRWDGPHGIGRFAREVFARNHEMIPISARTRLFHPLDPILLSVDVRRARPDVYFTPGFNIPLSLNCPFVLTIHDLNYVYCRENTDLWRRTYFEMIVRPACRQAYRVLTVSEFSREQILTWGGLSEERVVNVGNGVGEQFVAGGERHDPGFPYLLVVGSTGAHKNIVRLIQAFHKSGLSREVKLLISGSPRPDITPMVEELRLTHAIHLLGYVDERTLPSLYRGALAVCMPSLYEGFGLPVLEGMACGTPVLTSNVTCLPEIAGDAALLVDPTQVDAIADGLQRLVYDDSLRSALKEKGLARSRQFSWARTAASVRDVLLDACR